MHITEKRTSIILEALQNKHDAQWCQHYGERGCQDPESGIVFANRNNISKRIGNYLSEAGYECEWSDEWYIDHNHGKAWRTSPDSYSWVCALVLTDDGEYLTPDDGASEVIEALAMTDYAQPARAVPDWVTVTDIEAEGYTAINGDYETGFHPGQTDDPVKIARKAFDAGAESVVFRIKEASQFYTVFQGYRKGGE